MELKDYDYQALKELRDCKGWEILCIKLDERIKAIENVLLNPTLTDML
jgi:hypothetical protein